MKTTLFKDWIDSTVCSERDWSTVHAREVEESLLEHILDNGLFPLGDIYDLFEAVNPNQGLPKLLTDSFLRAKELAPEREAVEVFPIVGKNGILWITATRKQISEMKLCGKFGILFRYMSDLLHTSDESRASYLIYEIAKIALHSNLKTGFGLNALTKVAKERDWTLNFMDEVVCCADVPAPLRNQEDGKYDVKS